MSALLPPLLLLLWSAVAATLLTTLVLAPLLGESAGALALSPRHASLGQSLALGLLVLPLCYGAGFALSHEANLLTGALFACAHAGLLALRSFAHGGTDLLRDNRNRILLCIAYGAVLGFTYVTP